MNSGPESPLNFVQTFARRFSRLLLGCLRCGEEPLREPNRKPKLAVCNSSQPRGHRASQCIFSILKNNVCTPRASCQQTDYYRRCRQRISLERVDRQRAVSLQYSLASAISALRSTESSYSERRMRGSHCGALHRTDAGSQNTRLKVGEKLKPKFSL